MGGWILAGARRVPEDFRLGARNEHMLELEPFRALERPNLHSARWLSVVALESLGSDSEIADPRRILTDEPVGRPQHRDVAQVGVGTRAQRLDRYEHRFVVIIDRVKRVYYRLVPGPQDVDPLRRIEDE